MTGISPEIMPVGNKSQIDTPALLIDLDAMESNIATMAHYFEEVPAELRPHFKTHKSPILAHKQIEAGAIGITCAKLGEAEILVNAGIKDILIANQIVGPTKIMRLAHLARHAHLIVAVDNEGNIRHLSTATERAGSALRVVIEVDVGLGRCGVPPGEPAVRLAQIVGQSPGLEFAGILGYEGHAVFIPEREERRKAVDEAMAALVHTAEQIRQAGIAVEIVSAGGTGTYDLAGQHPGVTEVEAGSYILMDAKYREIGLPFRCALTLLAAVISVPTPRRAVIDAGKKVITTEFGLPEILSSEGVRLVSLHEEHGILEVNPERTEIQIGDKVELVPSHVCTTVNLHDWYYAIRGHDVEAIWPIAARGKAQ
jgi:D-serine deaminase-like pyridoxal phosphate-dependent protein